MRQASSVLLWTGGLLLAALGTATVAYAVTERAQKPKLAPGANVLQPGQSYLIAAPIPPGVTTVDQLGQSLASQGFGSFTVVYFGPQGILQSSVPIPFSVSATMYVAQVTPANPVPVVAGMQWVAL